MSATTLAENVTVIYSNLSFNYDNQTVNIGIHQKPSAIVPAVMFASGTIGNILALYVLIRSAKTHKWKVFYRLVGALAMTDLFGIVATSPVTLLTYANDLKWIGGQQLCDYFSFMLIFAGLATVFIVGAMSLDRYIAVCFPYYYNVSSAQKRRINYMIISLWIVSIFIAFLPLMGLGSNVLQYPGTWCFFNFFGTKISDAVFSYFYSCIGILIISMTACLNVIVILTLSKHRIPTRRKSSTKRKDSVASTLSRAQRNNIYIMIFLVAIVIVFGTCWTPLMIRVLINQSHLHVVDRRADLMAVRMASFNQILDPWVYILLRKEFITTVVLCLRRCTRRRNLLYRLTSYSVDHTTTEETRRKIKNSTPGSDTNNQINHNVCDKVDKEEITNCDVFSDNMNCVRKDIRPLGLNNSKEKVSKSSL